MYRPLLGTTLIDALNLQTTPERCTTEMLYIELKRTPHKDVSRYFTVEKTSSFSIAEMKKGKFGRIPDKLIFDFILEKSQQIRAAGGIGVAVAIIHIKEVDITHLTPTMLRFSSVDVCRDEQWASTFTDRVAAGHVD